MLHTLSVSPAYTDLYSMIRLMKEGDDLLLLSDGIIAAIAGGQSFKILQSFPVTIYALQDDIVARGLTAHIASSVIPASYMDFVRLTIKHPQQLAW
ncbi:sulfurtransferase complex subunit TusB [Enterobacteriaceae bacterium ESL0689]|nr:sulfurtransferase complex subunit TusB [Enterobacteriaceae bacterium ESL0689]